MYARQAKHGGLPIASLGIGALVATSSLIAWSTTLYPLDARAALSLGGRSFWSIAEGQPWRLFSAGLLHHDLAHIAWNLIPALPLMALLERNLGWLRSTIVVVAGMVFGHGLGAAVSAQTTVGFSPALFAVAAATGLILWQRHPNLARLTVVYLLVGLVASWRVPSVDAASHLGGAIAGLVGAWGMRSRLGLAPLLALAAMALFGLPPAKAPAPQTWILPELGLRLEVDGALQDSGSPLRRCLASGEFCLQADSQTAARLGQIEPWPSRCADSLWSRPDRCLVRRGEGLCLRLNRGLFEQQICAIGSPKLMTRFSVFLRQIEHIEPTFPGGEDDPLQGAVLAHRMGRVAEARARYAEAMAAAPMDAKAPFLAAVLELDFGAGAEAAEPLAQQAVALDPLHPDGRALMDEIRGRLGP